MQIGEAWYDPRRMVRGYRSNTDVLVREDYCPHRFLRLCCVCHCRCILGHQESPFRNGWVGRNLSVCSCLNRRRWSMPTREAGKGRYGISWMTAPQPPQTELHPTTIETVRLNPKRKRTAYPCSRNCTNCSLQLPRPYLYPYFPPAPPNAALGYHRGICGGPPIIPSPS